MEAKYEKQRNATLAAAVAAALAIGLAGPAWAQQAEESRPGTASSEAARELREAQREVKDAGEAVSEARSESREAVREGREAGSAAQEALREENRAEAARGADAASSSSGAGTTSSGQDAVRRDGTTAAGDASQDRTRTAAAGDTQSSSQRGSGPDAVWLFVPVAVSTQTEKQSNDCWVRLYSGENFDGRYVTITGPAEIRELRSPYGTGLNNWESAVVGTNATVMTYDGDDFEDRSATLRGGQRYADLGDAKLGLFEDIESIRVTCGSSSGQQAGQSPSSQQSSGRTQP